MWDFYKLLRTAWPYIGAPLGLYSLARAVDFNLEDLISWIGLAAGYVISIKFIFLFVALVILYFAITRYRHRNYLLCALDVDISLKFDTTNPRRVTQFRKQRLRAYQDGVTGYLRKIDLDPPGVIEPNSIEFNVNHCPTDRQRVLRLLDGPPSYRLLHRFDEIPRKLILFGLNHIERTETYTCTDAFNPIRDYYELRMEDYYKYKRIRVKIQFPTTFLVNLSKCSAIRVHSGVVQDLLPQLEDTHAISLTITKPRPGDTFRIDWDFT
jgi:hypothetical protein